MGPWEQALPSILSQTPKAPASTLRDLSERSETLLFSLPIIFQIIEGSGVLSGIVGWVSEGFEAGQGVTPPLSVGGEDIVHFTIQTTRRK